MKYKSKNNYKIKSLCHQAIRDIEIITRNSSIKDKIIGNVLQTKYWIEILKS